MKRFIGLGTIAAVVLAGLALPTRGALIFVDNFEDTVRENSSPAAGQPGGGEIGGTGFWSFSTSSGLINSDATKTNGVLYLVSETEDGTDRGIRYYTGANYPELNFLDQPLILKVDGFTMNWEANAVGLIEIGFVSGTSAEMHGNSNCVSFTIRKDGELRRRIRQSGTNMVTAWSSVPGLSHGPITDFTIYIDSTIYRFEVTYTNGTTGASDDIAHGFDLTLWSNMGVNMTMRTRADDTNNIAVRVAATMEKITVIPEPGALSLVLGSMGAALLVRRARRRA